MSHQDKQQYLVKKRKFKKVFSVIFIILGVIVAIFLLIMLIKIVSGLMPKVGEEAMGLFVN